MANRLSKKHPILVTFLLSVAAYYVYFIGTTATSIRELSQAGSNAALILTATSALTLIIMPVIHLLLMKKRKLGWMLCTIQLFMSLFGKVFALFTLGLAGFDPLALIVLAVQLLAAFLLFNSHVIMVYEVSSRDKAAAVVGAATLKVLLGTLIWFSGYY